MIASSLRLVSRALMIVILCCSCSTMRSSSPTENPNAKKVEPAKPVATLVHVTSRMRMRQGPSTKYPVCGSLRPGDHFYILGQQANWYRVAAIEDRNTPGPVGWIYKKYVHKLEPIAVNTEPVQTLKEASDQAGEKTSEDSKEAEKPEKNAPSSLNKGTVAAGVACVAAGTVVGLPLVVAASALIDGIKALMNKDSDRITKGDFEDDDAFLEYCVEVTNRYQEAAQENNENLAALIKQWQKQKRKGKIDPQQAEAIKQQKELLTEYITALEKNLQEQEDITKERSIAPEKLGDLEEAIAGTRKELEELRNHLEELQNLLISASLDGYGHGPPNSLK